MISFAASLANARWMIRRLRRKPISQPGVDDRWIPWGGAGVALLMVSALLVTALMILFDDDIILAARQAPIDVIGFFRATTDIGKSWWSLTISGIGLIIIWLIDWTNVSKLARIRARELTYDLAFVFYCVAISGGLANVTKKLIGRGRPKFLDDYGHLVFEPGRFESSWASFPSGHSTTFGALAMLLILRWPQWTPVWILFGLAGGASRVMVDAHYPSDAITGLWFGATFTWLTARWLAQRKIMFRFQKGSLIPERRLPDLQRDRD